MENLHQFAGHVLKMFPKKKAVVKKFMRAIAAQMYGFEPEDLMDSYKKLGVRNVPELHDEFMAIYARL